MRARLWSITIAQQARSSHGYDLLRIPCLDSEGRTVWIGQRVQPIIKEGLVAGFRAIARDVTDRRIAEDARREFEERFHSFMNNSAVVGFLKEPAGRLVYVNNEMERVFGRPGRSLIGSFDDDFFPDGTEEIRTSDDEVLVTDRMIKVLEPITSKANVSRQCLVYKFPVRSGRHAARRRGDRSQRPPAARSGARRGA